MQIGCRVLHVFDAFSMLGLVCLGSRPVYHLLPPPPMFKRGFLTDAYQKGEGQYRLRFVRHTCSQ